MKCEIKELENRGLPYACCCCDNKFTYHKEKYKSIVIGEIEIDLHMDCYDNFVKSLKSFVDTL